MKIMSTIYINHNIISRHRAKFYRKMSGIFSVMRVQGDIQANKIRNKIFPIPVSIHTYKHKILLDYNHNSVIPDFR